MNVNQSLVEAKPQPTRNSISPLPFYPLPSKGVFRSTSPGAELHLASATTDDEQIIKMSFEATTAGKASSIMMGAGSQNVFKSKISHIRESTYGVGRLGFFTSPTSTGEEDGTIERMSIDRDGNVGIGTTAPERELVINGTDISTGVYEFDAGNLLVNTTNAQGADIGGSIGLGGLYHSAANSFRTFGMIKGAKDNSTLGHQHGYLSFMTSSNGTLGEGMRITSDGNVGIGTTAPGAKLDVAGDVSISGNKIVTNGVAVYYYSGYAYNNAEIQVEVPFRDVAGSVILIEAYHTHNTTAYAALLNTVLLTYSGTICNQLDQLNITSTHGGAWYVTLPGGGLVRVRKSAGDYPGTGNYWIRITCTAP